MPTPKQAECLFLEVLPTRLQHGSDYLAAKRFSGVSTAAQLA
jgi:hypothetical protein